MRDHLPIHFFTIVLNGMPYIRQHIGILKKLKCEWHWHIIEGIADLVGDTGWSKQNGGRISPVLHDRGRSIDGTSAYLDELSSQYKKHITVYRKPLDVFWHGKLEMIQSPLAAIKNECLLWQLDVDEIWTAEQIQAAHSLFQQHPDKTSAYYYCHFFVGPDLVTTTRDTYGNYTRTEWLRTWRYLPGDYWRSHEPPQLMRPSKAGEPINLGLFNPFRQNETSSKGLVFQHYAYATEAQLEFKEAYYGYENAVKQWLRLQAQEKFPVKLKNFFGWVKDEALVDRTINIGIDPIIDLSVSREKSGSCLASYHPNARSVQIDAQGTRNILFVRIDAIGDAVLCTSMLQHLKSHFPHARINVLCQKHVAEIYDAIPYVDVVISIDKLRAYRDGAYRAGIAAQLQEYAFDLAIHSTWSRESIADYFTIASKAGKTIGMLGDDCNLQPAVMEKYNAIYSHLIHSHGSYRHELMRSRDLLNGIGIPCQDLYPDLWLTSDDTDFARHFFQSNSVNPQETIILIAGTLTENRKYEFYGKALDPICRDRKFTVVSLGSQKDRNLSQRNLDAIGCRSFNLCGQTTIRQAAAIIKLSRLVVGAETGLAHIACAVQTPNVVLLGGGHFGRFMPYTSLTTIACLPLECYGCNWNCRYSKPHCVCDVRPSVIQAAVLETLARPADTVRIFAQDPSLWNANANRPVWNSPDNFIFVNKMEIYSVSGFPAIDRNNGGRANNQLSKFQPEDIKKYFRYDDPLGKSMSGCRVTVIIPTKNKGDGLKKTLDSMPEAMLDIPYEILLYADKRNEEYADLINKYPIKEIFYDQDIFDKEERFSWSKLMNHGFARAAGDWIMYGSDDIVFYPGCFKTACGLLHRLRDESVGGVAFFHRNTAETYDGFFRDFGYDTLNADKPFINFGLIKADAYRKTNGFDEKLGFFWADVDICVQLLQCGYKIIPSPGSLVDHNNILEKRQKDRRISLYKQDMAYFYSKWCDDRMFKQRNPLQKVRYYLDEKDGLDIIGLLSEKLADLSAPGKNKKTRIVIDGVIFQLQSGKAQGILRVWRNLIPELIGQMPDAHITILQRDGYPIPLDGVNIHKIPPYQLDDARKLDEDDEMLRQTCRDLEADLFLSTYFTRAPGVKNVVMVHDLIAEKLQFDILQAEWLSKQRAVETADAFVCVSQATQSDLLRIYPHTETSPMVVAHNGLDPCFKSAQESNGIDVRTKLGISKDYLLLVGNRQGYKGGVELLSALSRLPSKKNLSVLCVGGENQPSTEELALQHELDLHYPGQLPDSELAAAYSGAMALMVPSQYEGFGLPVIEAMACDCPVIAEKSPAIAEIGGDAVYFADLSCPDSIYQALQTIVEPSMREQMVTKARMQAAQFDWADTAGRIGQFIKTLMDGPSILLTAVVSTYNAVDYIQGCLEDLEKQTLADRMEVIVVDSASEQDEASTVKAFQRRHPNIKYIRTPRRETVYQAWNRGIKFATGKYVSNANTDDRHRHDAFEQMVRVLEENDDIALVYADVIKTRTPNETFRRCTPTGMFRWHDWDRKTLLEKGCFIGPQPVWRKDVHQEYGYFSEEFAVSADFEFWLRISQTHEFYHIPKPLGLYMDRADSIEHANTLRKKQEDQTILDRYRNADRQNIILGGQHDRQKLTDMDFRQKNISGPKVDRGINTTHTATLQGGHDMHSKEVLLKTVEQLIDSGHKEAALWILGNLVADFPEEAALHSAVAVLAYEQGQRALSREHFKSAVSLEPENISHRKALGDYYYAVEKNAEAALEQYACLLKVDPQHLESLVMAGHIAVSLHRYAQAQDYYQRVLDLDPGNAEVRRLLDKMRHAAPEQGASVLSVDELYTQAQVKIREADHPSAIDLLKRLLAQDDTHALAHNDLGVLLYEAGDLQAACTHYERASALQPENEIFQRNLADFYLAAVGDSQRAMQAYVQVLKLNPMDVEAVLSCAQICIGMGRAEDSRDFIQAAMEMEPWNKNAQTLLRQLEEASQPKVSTGSDLFANAKAKAAIGDLQGAIDDLNRYVGTVPDDANAHNDLGVLYFESGAKDKAVTAYERAVHLKPTDLTYRKNLADFYLIEQGRIEEAMKLYIGVLEGNPQDLEALIACGMITASVGQAEDAKLFYHRALEIEPWNETARKGLEAIRDTGDQTSGDGYGAAAAG
jgi:ADP-heptose:LPS heptosyltransferase/tetratricopeptide (TPR) repeat protein/glycosyltransferase involved in cell wall biosynthesis/GT2 family glycosyltransferase